MFSATAEAHHPTRLPVLLACLLACAVLLSAAPAYALEPDYVSVIVGHGEGKLEPPQDEYDYTQLGVALGYDWDDWLDAHLGFNPPGHWSYELHGVLGAINEPAENIEFSSGGGLRVGFPLGRFEPFADAGGGLVLSSQDFDQQSTDLNFDWYSGVGLLYHLDERQAIGWQYAIRHFSNASLHSPNDGVDADSWVLVYSWRP